MRLPWQRDRPPRTVDVRRGERILSWCESVDGSVLAGTRDALYVDESAGTTRVPWEQVESARWDQESATLRVEEVGAYGAVRPAHVFTVTEPGRLLELVRERVSASVLWQQHVPVAGRRGVRVIARRAVGGRGAVSWFFDFDTGVDPDDPAVRQLAEEALARAKEGIGE